MKAKFRVKRKYLRAARKIQPFEFNPTDVQLSVIASVLEELEDGSYIAY